MPPKLDADEWAIILLALKSERERKENKPSYNQWLDSLIAKVQPVPH